jgi:hypothetical protein
MITFLSLLECYVNLTVIHPTLQRHGFSTELFKNSRSTARIVSILRARQERRTLNTTDLDIKHSKSKSAHLDDYAGAAETMNTLFLEQLARQHPDVCFVHKYPGLVKTSLFAAGWGQAWSAKRVFFTYTVPAVVGVVGMSDVEVGQRCVFTLVSATFGGEGVRAGDESEALRNSRGGKKGQVLFLVKKDGEEAVNTDILDGLRKGGIDQRVYEETKKVLGPYLHAKF